MKPEKVFLYVKLLTVHLLKSLLFQTLIMRSRDLVTRLKKYVSYLTQLIREQQKKQCWGTSNIGKNRGGKGRGGGVCVCVWGGGGGGAVNCKLTS